MAQFTAAEAAFVLREPVRAVKKSLDLGPVRPVLVRRAGASVRAIEWRDLFYLYAVRALRDELTPRRAASFTKRFNRCRLSMAMKSVSAGSGFPSAIWFKRSSCGPRTSPSWPRRWSSRPMASRC
jgi:hypothetical protein